MMRKFLTVLAGMFVFCSVFGNLTPDTWTTTTSLNYARWDHTATLLPSGKVLVAGGDNDDYGWLQIAELYDPDLGTWTRSAPMKYARVDHTATLLQNGKVLATGGLLIALSSAEVYDPATDIWTLVASMKAGRCYHTATLLPNGKVLVVGGRNKDGIAINEIELYDPGADTWTVLAPMPVGCFNHTAILLPNNFVLVSGGRTSDPVNSTTNNVYLYDIANNKWTSTGSLNLKRSFHTATLLPTEEVLVAGGENSSAAPIVNTELYNVTSGQWTNATPMYTARFGHSVEALLNKQLLLVGGSTSSNTELYNSTSTQWTNTTGSLSTARLGHTSTLLPTGQVLVAGGHTVGSTVSLSSAELYYGASTLKTIVVTGGSTNVTSGNQTPAYIATGYDTYGNKVFDFPITWEAISDTGTATINGTGVATGSKDGNVTIRATSSDISNTTILNVIGCGAFASIGITGGSPTVASGNKTLPYVATGYDISNNTVPDLTFIWAAGTLNDTGTATIDSSTGVATGATPGLVTIKAMTSGITGTTTLNVTVAPTTSPTNNAVDQPSSTAWVIPTIVAPVVAAIGVAVGVYFYKRAKTIVGLSVPKDEIGVTKESSIITTGDGSLALMTVTIKDLSI